MKAIPLRTDPVKSVDLFRQAVTHSPQAPLSIDAMRRRCRVLDLLDDVEKAGGDSFKVEDGDHVTLCDALKSFPWAVASREILGIIDDAIGAKGAKLDS